MMEKWKLSKIDKEKIIQIAEENDISAFLALLLYTRGITDSFDIDLFLSNELDLADPHDFIDIEKAVNRIKKALNEHEKICIFGDYDADGITSTCLMYSYLKSCNGDVIYYISNRNSEGYGMNNGAIDCLKGKGVSLIVTVDNGISALNEIKYANKNNIDVIVTDHHQPNESLPDAMAIVNPHRNDCLSYFKDYAGVGVAFKLICAIEGENINIDNIMSKYGELVGIGTVADLVPLVEENRSIVKYIIKNIYNTSNIGIKALLNSSKLNQDQINSTALAFRVIPKINAIGRLETADNAVELLLTENKDKAFKIANYLTIKNDERKSIDKEIVNDIENILANNKYILKRRIIIVYSEKWHQGVIGIAASKIAKKYSKPCIVLSINEKEATASCRSVEDFSIYEAINYCRELLNKYGGHKMAAGFSIDTDNIDTFIEKIERYAYENNRIMPYNSVDICCKLNISSVNFELLDDIDKLQPFGMGNAEPILGLFEVSILEVIPLKGGLHTKLHISKNGIELSVIMFGQKTDELCFEKGDIVNITVKLSKNIFNGNENLSIIATGIRYSNLDYENILYTNRLYECFIRKETLSTEEKDILIPTRRECAIVYKFINTNQNRKIPFEYMLYKINSDTINFGKIKIILDIFLDLGLINYNKIDNKCKISLIPTSHKVDLMQSSIINRLK